MFCKYCGKNVKDNVRFCPNCGGKIEIQETLNESVNLPLQSFEKRADIYDEGNNDATTELAPVMSVWAYMGIIILQSIPVIGIIVLIVFALDGSKKNRANYCRATLLISVLGVILVALFWTSISGLVTSLLYSLM